MKILPQALKQGSLPSSAPTQDGLRGAHAEAERVESLYKLVKKQHRGLEPGKPTQPQLRSGCLRFKPTY